MNDILKPLYNFIRERHNQVIQDWLSVCLTEVCLREGWSITDRPFPNRLDSIHTKDFQLHGNLVTSTLHPNTIAFYWRGEHISTQTWKLPDFSTDKVLRDYIAYSYPLFPVDKQSIYPVDNWSI